MGNQVGENVRGFSRMDRWRGGGGWLLYQAMHHDKNNVLENDGDSQDQNGLRWLLTFTLSSF
jgi:hypothetical protein